MLLEQLKEKKYLDERATREMAQHLHGLKRTLQESLAYTARALAMTGQEAGLAGQITARSERPKAYWTLRFGPGFDEATPADFIEVDADLNTLAGDGMANPATRFHLWVYEARSDVNSIFHAHSPWGASALAAAREPVVISQMDMTQLHDDCASWRMAGRADRSLRRRRHFEGAGKRESDHSGSPRLSHGGKHD